MRSTISPTAHGYYSDLADTRKEFSRKVRTVVRGMGALLACRKFLNPIRYGMVSYQLLGHKILRWAVPWFLIIAITSNFYLAIHSDFYAATFVGQMSFYLLAATPYIWTSLVKYPVFGLPYYFVSVNIALCYAAILFLSGRRIKTWTPSAR